MDKKLADKIERSRFLIVSSTEEYDESPLLWSATNKVTGTAVFFTQSAQLRVFFESEYKMYSDGSVALMKKIPLLKLK